jgi:hypothetical protein
VSPSERSTAEIRMFPYDDHSKIPINSNFTDEPPAMQLFLGDGGFFLSVPQEVVNLMGNGLQFLELLE